MKLVALPALVALVFVHQDVLADTSAWVSVNGGATGFQSPLPGLPPEDGVVLPERDFAIRALLSFDAGVGTTPDYPVIFGGLFRVSPIVNEATDIAWLLRGATRGFQVGDFGVAVDAGGYIRVHPFDDLTGGFMGDLVLGLPLGFQITATGQVSNVEGWGVSATAGIDFLRLTLFRESLTDHWPNPSPKVAGPLAGLLF